MTVREKITNKPHALLFFSFRWTTLYVDNFFKGVSNTMQNVSAYQDLIHIVGFNSEKEFKDYMLKNAKENEFGALCHNEVRKGWNLNYSDNCKHKFGIGGNYKGIFNDFRF